MVEGLRYGGMTVADPGEGLGGLGPSLPYFQTKLRPEGPEKKGRPPPLSKSLDDRATTPPPQSQSLHPALHGVFIFTPINTNSLPMIAQLLKPKLLAL